MSAKRLHCPACADTDFQCSGVPDLEAERDAALARAEAAEARERITNHDARLWLGRAEAAEARLKEHDTLAGFHDHPTCAGCFALLTERDGLFRLIKAAEGREAVLREALEHAQAAFESARTHNAAVAQWWNDVAWLRLKVTDALASPSPRAEELLAAEKKLAAVAELLEKRQWLKALRILQPNEKEEK